MSCELTFAEAMALDPGEVEVQGGDWAPTAVAWASLKTRLHWELSALRDSCKFRHARPKRRLVDEIAVRDWGGPHVDSSEAFAARAMTEAICAVCEYLRSRPDIEANVRRQHPDDEMADAIERHFLEPR